MSARLEFNLPAKPKAIIPTSAKPAAGLFPLQAGKKYVTNEGIVVGPLEASYKEWLNEPKIGNLYAIANGWRYHAKDATYKGNIVAEYKEPDAEGYVQMEDEEALAFWLGGGEVKFREVGSNYRWTFPKHDNIWGEAKFRGYFNKFTWWRKA